MGNSRRVITGKQLAIFILIAVIIGFIGLLWLSIIIVIGSSIVFLYKSPIVQKTSTSESQQKLDIVVTPIQPVSPNTILDMNLTHEEELVVPINIYPQSIVNSSSKVSRIKENIVATKWYRSGETVKVEDYTINDGMIYVGRNLHPSSNEYRNSDPALINPTLPINQKVPDFSGSTLSYYNSYDSITPECRAAYLEWLSTGRSDPKANIGYVFLFYNGLERRLLYDAERQPLTLEERKELHDEIYRLITIYGNDYSFNRYATSLINYIETKYLDLEPKPNLLINPIREYYPGWLKIKLAKYALQGLPVPFELAYTWFIQCPETFLRTPALRCAKEFKTLFRIKYTAEFGEGLIIPPNKTMISVSYNPASYTFAGKTILYKSDTLPDITCLSRPINSIKAIGETCTNELDSYSRFLGRRPNEANTIFALSLMPEMLLKSMDNPLITSLLELIKSTPYDCGQYILKISHLLEAVGLPINKEYSQSDSILVCQFLGKLGYGIEPDVRFGGTKLKPTETAVLFPIESNKIYAPSQEYTSALLLLSLASLVCHADGTYSKTEEEKLENHISSALQLETAETQRLLAHVHYLVVSPLSISKIKKKVEGLDEIIKKNIVQFLIFIAFCDGNVVPDEIKILTKIYTWFGLDISTISSDIHVLQTSMDTPVVVAQADTQSQKGYTIPKPPFQKENPRVVINQERRVKIINESDKVTDIIIKYLGEQEDEPNIPPQRQNKTSKIKGLNNAHYELFERICNLDKLPYNDFEVMCKELYLLPMGAIETLNDVVFEYASELFIETEDDMLLFNKTIAKELYA